MGTEGGGRRRLLLCLRRIPNTQADTFFGSTCGYTNTFLAPVKHFISPLGEPVIKSGPPPPPSPPCHSSWSVLLLLTWQQLQTLGHVSVPQGDFKIAAIRTISDPPPGELRSTFDPLRPQSRQVQSPLSTFAKEGMDFCESLRSHVLNCGCSWLIHLSLICLFIHTRTPPACHLFII